MSYEHGRRWRRRDDVPARKRHLRPIPWFRAWSVPNITLLRLMEARGTPRSTTPGTHAHAMRPNRRLTRIQTEMCVSIVRRIFLLGLTQVRLLPRTLACWRSYKDNLSSSGFFDTTKSIYHPGCYMACIHATLTTVDFIQWHLSLVCRGITCPSGTRSPSRLILKDLFLKLGPRASWSGLSLL